jgi:hypothetical protein
MIDADEFHAARVLAFFEFPTEKWFSFSCVVRVCMEFEWKPNFLTAVECILLFAAVETMGAVAEWGEAAEWEQLAALP